MARLHVLIAATILTAPLPAAASILTLDSNAARMCFVAADSRMMPIREDLAQCDTAIGARDLARRDLVATHVNRGILRLRLGNVDGATQDFETASRIDPNEPEAYLNRGSVMLRQAQDAPAVTMFNEALQRNTRRPAYAHYGRALAYESLGNVRAAYHDYRRASELAPGWDAPRAELGRFRVTGRN